MNRLYNFLRFCLCIMTIGGMLGLGGHRVFADIKLSEKPSGISDKPIIVVEFDNKRDILNLNMALRDVFGTLEKHSGSAMCPYEMLYLSFVSSFEDATGNTCFLGNSGIMIRKVCAIFTDILLHGSMISELGTSKIVCVSYKAISEIAKRNIADVVGAAYNDGISKLEIVYDAEAGYVLK